MNGWPNPGQANGMFQGAAVGHLNPAAMYNNNNTTTVNPNFDLGQFQPGLQNGNTSTPTPAPAFNQTFQPGSVVPAKRPHDGMSGSPQQPQPSRSRTPSFPNFPNQPSQFPNAPTPYQHLQQPGSNNATPSPTMANQQFRPPTQPPQPRMQSPFPPQPQANFGNHMSPSTPQQGNPQVSMPQQGQMGGWNPGMGMNSMGMGGMSAIQNQMSMMQGNNNAHRAYQLKLMQQQEQLRRTGLMGPRPAQPGQMNNFPGQQAGGQMTNGQMNPQMAMAAQQNQQAQQKREGFLKTLQQQAQQQGRPFNPAPTISGRPVDLYMLWSMAMGLGGSRSVDSQGQWQMMATKLGFHQAQYPSAAEEIKQLYLATVAGYERMFFAMRAQQKQNQARLHAQQMAGVNTVPQQSPSRAMQPPTQQPQQTPQYNQFQHGQQGQPGPPMTPAHSTPMQANAQLPQSGMTTPQQAMQHRRNSSIRKPEQMTPQVANQAMTARSPSVKVQRSPSVKQELGGPVMKSEEPQSTNYIPHMRSIDLDGGYDVSALFDLGTTISRAMPNMPTVDEMGVIDVRAITLSLASGIHGEVRYALDALTIISRDERVHFELEKCEDLLDILVDAAEEQVEMLSDEAAEVSDALDLPCYEDIIRGCRAEAESLREVPEFGTPGYELDRAVDRLIAISTIMRNFSFFEHNHKLLTSPPLVKWLSNTIRLIGTRNMLLRTFGNTLDFYKDIICLLSNITQSLELTGRDDALHILHFLLAFAPQPSPCFTESGGKVRFASFVPSVHRFLPPAVDCLAKLLARQDPNRMLYRSIFTASTSSLAASESPSDLLTRAFALSISVLPDRARGSFGITQQLRIVEARKSYLCQGMLAADILASLAPSNDKDLARAWIEAEDGWAVGLLNLAGVLSVDRSHQASMAKGQLGQDTESFKLITHRALSMMKRLAEKAGRGSIANVVGQGDEEVARALKWEGIPQCHSILGALMTPTIDKVALGLLCGLHDMAMQT